MTMIDTKLRLKDFSTTGVKLEGPWETDRNRGCKKLIKDILKECFGGKEFFVGHHIAYEVTDKVQGAIDQEIPSIDTMIFEHTIARKIWGEVNYKNILAQLACEPVETRDQMLAKLYYSRKKVRKTNGRKPVKK
jgi:hypothetical protein